MIPCETYQTRPQGMRSDPAMSTRWGQPQWTSLASVLPKGVVKAGCGGR